MDAGSPGGDTNWLLNALFGIALAVSSAFAKLQHSRLVGLEDRLSKSEDDHDDIDKRLVKVESTTLEAEQIRNIVAEHVAPINQAHTEIFGQLRDINSGFSDLRVDLEKRLPRE